MARRKKPRRKEEKRLPDWAKAIQELYEVLGCGTQEEFAARLRFKQGTVSTWLRGDETRKPSADTLIRMAEFAPKPDLASRFLALANISDEAIFSVARKLETDRLREAAPLIKKGDIVLVSSSRETLEGREEAGPSVLLPREFIPNPRFTSLLQLDETSALNGFVPGDILVLDTRGTEAQKPGPFLGQVVAAKFIASTEADEDLAIYQGSEQPVVGLVVFQVRKESDDWIASLQPIAFVTPRQSLGIGRWHAVPGGLTREQAKKQAVDNMPLARGWEILGRVVAYFPHAMGPVPKKERP